MAVNTTATLSVENSFSQQDTTTDSLTNRNGSLGYSQSLTSGTGSLNVDAVLDLQNHTISAGSHLYLDLTAASQPVLGSNLTLSFSNINTYVSTSIPPILIFFISVILPTPCFG